MSRSDMPGMDDDDLQLLAENPACERLLRDYADRTAALEPQGEETGPRYVDRIDACDALDAVELAELHGQLIALGWLNFELQDGKSGLVYRVSSEGRRALSALDRLAAQRLEDAVELAA